MPTRDAGPFPTADEIAERAHELFTSGGRRVSMIREYWRAAERELLQRAADRFIEAERLRTGARRAKRRAPR